MADTTLISALSAIADAIRAKGVTGTMSALEMPTKIASIPQGGGGGTKYGVSVDALLGDIDSNGQLQNPNVSPFDVQLSATSIVSSGFHHKFNKCSGIRNVSMPSL